MSRRPQLIRISRVILYCVTVLCLNGRSTTTFTLILCRSSHIITDPHHTACHLTWYSSTTHILSIQWQKHPDFAVRLTHIHHQILFSKYVSSITTLSVFACWPSIVVTRSLQDISERMVCAHSLCGLCRKV